MKKYAIRLLSGLFFILFAYGCGGSSSPAPNTAPTANAGIDQHVYMNDSVTLDASASTDSDGDTLTYTWTLQKPEGSLVLFSDTSVMQPTFTPDIEGTYIATLKVSDSKIDSAPDQIDISVTPVSLNRLTYKIITSPVTDKKWLDRNLGATKVCDKSRDDGTFVDDAAYVTDQKDCFGNYYQWGRKTNGHEEYDSTSSAILLDNDVDSGGEFITADSGRYDWRVVQNDLLWNGASAPNNICPTGFKIPSATEIKAETIEATGVNTVNSRDSAFKSFLKLPISGLRDNNGNHTFEGVIGGLWSSTANYIGSEYFVYGSMLGSTITAEGGMRTKAFPIRCIRDKNLIDTLVPTVYSWRPDESVTDINIDTNISFIFSEPMDADTLTSDNIWLIKSDEPNNKLDVTLTQSGIIVKLNPSAELKYDTNYQVVISSNVKDKAGNAIEQTQHNFKTTDSIIYDLSTYKVITSPITGKVWLDRNLGAEKACDKQRSDFADDSAYVADQKSCFGGYLQWGRIFNSHAFVTMGTSTVLLDEDTDFGGRFILSTSFPYDWRTTKENSLWENSSLNADKICPNGFRVPSIVEISNEMSAVTNIADAFNSFLKLPASGLRKYDTGDLSNTGNRGYLWSATAVNTEVKAQAFNFNYGSGTATRATGFPVRCVQK